MKSIEDRRAPEIRRVPITTLVELCTQSGEISPFQAQSANVSGRGMSVSTRHLPEIGEELVCRFHQDEQEILVEGRVAWRSEGIDSGEFGIQFTALDADSAHILQSLGEDYAAPPSSLSPVVTAEVEEDDEVEFLGPGERVKLHIHGLGAPMKACVHEGSARKLRVGSSLEFLKMGRSIEIEDVEGGEKRGAHIDMVNVVINPTTLVPELVVQLRYEGVTPTPAPAKTKVEYDDGAFAHFQKAKGKVARPAQREEVEEEFSDEDPAPWQPAADALRSRLGSAMATAGLAAQKATGLMSTMAQSAKVQVSTAVQKRSQSASRRNPPTKHEGPSSLRRQQSTRVQSRVAPSYLRSGIHEAGLAGKHRPVGHSRGAERASSVVPGPKRKLRAAAIFGAAFLVFGVSAYGFRSFGSGDGKAGTSPALSAQKKAELPAASKTAGSATPPPAATKPAEPTGVVTEVPLFGPQSLAEEPASPTLSPDEEVRAEKLAAAAEVPDETWEEKPVATETSDQQPWGNGRLYLPTVHRIRLDGVAQKFQGSVSDDGFTVVVPGHKAMESGKSIQKRDKRVMAVQSNNNARGATVKFQFRGPVPPYRVRLRKDFVEFLISAPEETVARL